MKSWNTKVIAVEDTQYGPKLVFSKKDGSQGRADLGCQVDPSMIGRVCHVSFDDSGQFWRVVKVEPEKQRPTGGGSRWQPEPPEKTALTTAAGIVKSALEGGHCKTYQDAQTWLNAVFPVCLGLIKVKPEEAPHKPPAGAIADGPIPGSLDNDVQRAAMGQPASDLPPVDAYSDDIPF